jgi:hypothetical protein
MKCGYPVSLIEKELEEQYTFDLNIDEEETAIEEYNNAIEKLIKAEEQLAEVKEIGKAVNKSCVFTILLVIIAFSFLFWVISREEDATQRNNEVFLLNDFLKVGDTFRFGTHNWQVLVVEEDRALIITERVVTERRFHTDDSAITWANSDMRKWLNDDFYNRFNEDDKSKIIGEIFLLSVEEATQYFISNSARIANLSGHGGRATWWWLRTPSSDIGSTAGVNVGGAIIEAGVVNTVTRGVRPALWIELENN